LEAAADEAAHGARVVLIDADQLAWREAAGRCVIGEEPVVILV